MKRALGLGVLLIGAGMAMALTTAEIRCAFLGTGGGEAASASHDVQFSMGPTVVGTSTSAQHELVHGPVPCRHDVVTAVADDPDGVLPAVLRLHQNAPNPFNPLTAIRYDLPQDASRVQLAVYDLGGRRVRVLVDGPQPAGQQSVIWNGQDDAGRAVASGVYIYRLDTPQQRITRKMTLLK